MLRVVADGDIAEFKQYTFGTRVAWMILALSAVVCTSFPGTLHVSLAPDKITSDQGVTRNPCTARGTLPYVSVNRPASELVAAQA